MKASHLIFGVLVAASVAPPSTLANEVQVDPIVRTADSVWTGESSLLRFSNRIQAVIRTSDLDPGAAVTIWWRIYNRPEHCAVAYACEAADLSNPKVNGSQLHAAAFVVDDAQGEATVVTSLYRVAAQAQGRQRFSNSLEEDYLTGRGLRRPKNAEVELLIASHGRLANADDVGDEAALEQFLTPTGTRIDCADPTSPVESRTFRCGVIQRVDHGGVK